MRLLISCLLLIVGAFFLFFAARDPFSLDNISPYHAEHLGWILPATPTPLPKEFDSLFNQPFTYLGKGRQTYVFLSADQKYVVKFIKFTYLKPSFFRPKKEQLKRLQRVLTGYQLAFDRDRENTGVLYIHFQTTDHLKKKIQVKDKYHFKHWIDLDQVYFILQKKGVMTRHRLKTLLKNKEVDTAKQQIRKILDLYVAEYKKGLFDSDHNVIDNTGFIDQDPIRLDVGRLKSDETIKRPEIFKEDLEKIAQHRLRKWIKKCFPQYYEELMADINDKMDEILGPRV